MSSTPALAKMEHSRQKDRRSASGTVNHDVSDVFEIKKLKRTAKR